MKIYWMTSHQKILVHTGLLGISVLIMIMMSGCLENYGRLNRSSEIQEAFETNQVPSEYNYYFYGRRNMPYAVMGLDVSYNLRSRMWRTVESDSAELRHMAYWIWADYGYYPYGANILDPEGQKIGIIYTSSIMAAVKFDKETKTVEVMPHIFLGGP